MHLLIAKRNNVKLSGKGVKTMVFAHGFGCDQNMWPYVAPAFVEDFQILLFDHVGHGHSDLSAYSSVKYDNLNGYAEDLTEICREANIIDGIFIGHSVSAMVAHARFCKRRFARL